MDTDDRIFFAKDNKGKERKFEIIYKFDSNQTKKSYIVYTDGEKENGLLKVYANTYDKTGASNALLPIETEEEWNTIEAFLSKLEDLSDEKN